MPHLKKPGEAADGYQISDLSVTRLKLFAFWARHMWRTCRSVDDWTDTTWDEVSILKKQKTLKKSLQDRKTPKNPVMTFDTQSAAKTFLDMVVLLGKMRGISGIPLAYLTRCKTSTRKIIVAIIPIQAPRNNKLVIFLVLKFY